MATAQDQSRPLAPSKHEALVEAQLDRVLRRIRFFDVTAGLLGFAAGTLVYGLAMMLADRAWELSTATRLLALGGYGLAAAAYLVRFFVWPLVRPVNPYYAAVQVEHVIPGAKNSIINWLDLRARKLPPAIRSAVGARAARDVGQADIDQAISGRRVTWLAGVALATFVTAVVVLAVLRPAQFFSLVGRVFAPFEGGAIKTQTQLQLVQPQGGTLTVPVNQPVDFRVRVGGKVPQAGKPDALKLKFRYSQDEPVYQERALEPGDGEREWGVRLPGFEVKNGFWYKITGGDAETPEYRVEARANPAVLRFEVTYKYRPYLFRKDRTDTSPTLQDLRGTEVTVVAHTNRAVKEGKLRFEGEGEQPKPLAAMVQANQPDALRFSFVLEKSGVYRVRFTSEQGEESADSVAYPITVFPDLTPQVTLTRPGEDVTLPADGLLALEGAASDDFGLTDLTLRMKLKDGETLQPKVYRGDEKKDDQPPFRFPDDGYPRKLAYKDFIDLAKVRDAQGRAIKLRPGMVIEYWLEATDNCDYPKPNVGRTERTYLITIAPPPADPKQLEEDRKQKEEERKKLEQEQEQHKKQQNQELQREQQERKKEGEPKPEKTDLDKKLDEARQQLEKERDKGDLKKEPPPPPDKGQEKGPGPQDNPQQKPGDGQAKKNEQPKGDEGQAKPEKKDGQPQPKPGDQGQQKPDPGKDGNDPQQAPGQSKTKPDLPPDTKRPGEDKPGGDKSQAEKAGAEKGQSGSGKPDDGKKDGKPPAGKDQSTAKASQPAPGAAKGDPPQETKGHPKPSGEQGPASGQLTKGTEKKDGAPGDKPPKGKPKNEGSDLAKGNAQPKPDGDSSAGTPSAQGGPNAKPAPQQGATRDDVAAKANDLQGGQGQKRKDAARDLQDMARNAKDPEVRQAAKEALEKAGEQVGPGDATGTEPGQKPDQVSGATGKPAPDGEQPEGRAKGGTQGDPKAQGQEKAPDGDAGSGKSRPPAGQPKDGQGAQAAVDAKEGKGPGERTDDPGESTTTGGTPGGAQTGRRDGDPPAPGSAAEFEAMANDLRDKMKAGDLLLRDFKEAIKEKNTGKSPVLTPEEAERLARQMKQWAEEVKELEQAAKAGGGASYSSGPYTAKKPTGPGRNPIQGVGPLVPPSEFEKAYREFTQEMSRLKPKRDKK